MRAQAQAKQDSCIAPGSCDIDAEFRAAVSEDIKQAQNANGRALSRYEVAAWMSELVGTEITFSMLNNWTADSHEKHRMPAQYLPAFALVTGGRRAIEVISKKAGLFAVPGPEALRAEIHRITSDIKHKQEEKKKRELLLREVSR